jgi:hypothetical protein
MTIYKLGKPQKSIVIVVNKGIPIPKARSAPNVELYQAAKDLEVGDCIDIPYSRTGVSGNLARDIGYTFTQRKVGDILRIWRTK